MSDIQTSYNSGTQNGALVKGVIVSEYKDDPESINRVQVYIPALHGEFKEEKVGVTRTDENGEETDNGMYPWAQCCALDSLQFVPKKDMTVWIMFEGNDTRYPVVIGVHGISLPEQNVPATNDGQLGGLSGGTLAQLAAQIIFGNEGNYESIAWNDHNCTANPKNFTSSCKCPGSARGSISIGKIQWHANRARNLLMKIRSKESAKFDSIFSEAGVGNFSGQYLTESCSWGSMRYWSSSCPIGIAIKKVLATDEGHKAQDEQALEDVQGYLDTAGKGGITNPGCLIYLADIINQYGSCPSLVKSNKNNLDDLYQYSLKNGYGTYSSRRKKTYDAIKALEAEGKLNPNNLTDMSGELTMGSKILWPAVGVKKVSQQYTYGKGGNHAGIDIACPSGTSIVAVADGIVRISGYNSAYGNYICIYHESLNISSLSAHGSKLPLFSVGQKVKAGNKILISGNTGNSTGPHCHFSLCKGDCGSNNGHFGTYRGGAADSFDPMPWVQ